MNFLTQRVRPDKALARLSERVVAALIFIKRPGLLSHDATTGYRFAVTRWRREVDSNCRYRSWNTPTSGFSRISQHPGERPASVRSKRMLQLFVRNGYAAAPSG